MVISIISQTKVDKRYKQRDKKQYKLIRLSEFFIVVLYKFVQRKVKIIHELCYLFQAHETSGGILAFALFELSRNLSVQQTLFKEIMSIAPTGDFSLEDLDNMVYLEMTIKETIRLYPQVPFMERQIMEEFVLGKLQDV